MQYQFTGHLSCGFGVLFAIALVEQVDGLDGALHILLGVLVHVATGQNAVERGHTYPEELVEIVGVDA